MDYFNQSLVPNKLYDGGIPIGTIIIYPGEIYDDNGKLLEHLALGGWLEANGQSLSVKEYYCLYEIIGDKYNTKPHSSECFFIPDLRGLFIRGVQNDVRQMQVRQFLDDYDALNSKRLDYNTFSQIDSSKKYNQVGSLEKEAFREHAHQIKKICMSLVPEKGNECQAFGSVNPAGDMLTEIQGGIETRPTNIAMYFLIKARYSLLKKGNSL